jgi:hypothetical protein
LEELFIIDCYWQLSVHMLWFVVITNNERD